MEQILTLIEKYYMMKDGEFIENHQSFFIVHDDEIGIRLKYKTLKHIVEKRNNSYVLYEKNYKIKATMVAEDINLEDESVCIKTAFFKAATKTDKFIK